MSLRERDLCGVVRQSRSVKYSWFVAIVILPLVGATDIVHAMTYKDIAGQWCGDVTDYVFTPDTLTVQTGQCVQDHEIHLYR